MGKVITLYDATGREVFSEKPVTDELAQVTKDVHLQFTSFLGFGKGGTLQNPDKIIQRESGGLEIDIYEDIEDKDAHVACEVGKRRLAVSQIEYEIVPGSAKPEAEKIAEKVREYFNWIPNLTQALLALADACFKGYAVSEVMWEASEGDVWVKDLIGRRQRRFEFDTEGNIRLRTPTNMIGGEIMPPRKFLHHVFFGHKKDNPYGRGLGRVLYWPSWFKKNDIKFWVIFCEKFGMPTVKGTHPRGATEQEKTKLLEAIDAIQSRTGIIVPEGMLIELLEGQRTGSINTYESLFNAMNQEISKAVLGQTASAVGTPGKLGNEELQAEVRRDILIYDARSMAGVLQDLSDWLTLYNFGDVGRGMWPKVEPRLEEPEDLDRKIDRDTKAVEIGVPVGVDYFYDTYSLPRPEPQEQLVAPPERGQSLFPRGTVPLDFAETVKRRVKIREQEDAELEQYFAKAMKGVAGAFKRQLRALKDSVAAATSAADLTAPVPDPDFADYLSRVMATADLLAREHIAARGVPGIEDFAEIIPEPLAPRQAIDYFKRLKPVIAPEDLDAIDHAYDGRAFRVAGVTNRNLLDGIKSRLTTALEKGQTFEQWKDSVGDLFDRLGVTELAPHHLETIFRTNTQDAYMAGRWQQLQGEGMAEVFPYFQYHAVGDERTRPTHRAMDGFVARRDDPIWDDHWPPWEYNCRCSVTPVSKFEADDLGLNVKESGKGAWLTDEGKILRASPAVPSFDPYAYTPRFNNNPAKEIFGGNNAA